MRQPAQFASGFVLHLACGALFVFFAGAHLTPVPSSAVQPLVWASQPGFAGGGLGGDGVKAAPAAPRPTPKTIERFKLPHVPTVLGALELPGTVAVLSAANAVGTGSDDGRDAGRGGGGPGPGSGPGKGSGAGPGEGPFDAGAPGVIPPRVVFEKRPEYTAAAMAARIQGAILLEATVLADGSVGPVRIVRSLDDVFGLDQKAIEAIRAWKFRPGTYLEKPVAVRVLVELSFNLR
ncbi:MAG TPA: energy transducer TonB [Vicinamibacterales bacterium]